MAKISKDMYDARRESAARRMGENAKNSNLTEEQHECLEGSCRMRHEIHCNQSALFNTESGAHQEYWSFLEGLKERSCEVKLPYSGYVPDGIELPLDCDYDDEDIHGGKEWWTEDGDRYDAAYGAMIAAAERFNGELELYLAEIDSKYGTNYAPTGAQRIM